jgi:acetyltransferase-like isoleucine patch superfamily enzyme
MLPMTHRSLSFAPAFVEHLRWMGIDVGAMAPGLVHIDSVVEAPVTLEGLDIGATPVAIGAFSYFGPGGMFREASIGRYCSVSGHVQVGMTRHPSDWLTTSPIAYVGDFLNFERHFTGDDPAWRRAPALVEYDLRPRTTIGNDVWIGTNVYLKDGITVGDGAVIGAHSVVTHDVAPYAVVAGSPARVIRQRFPDALVERLLRIRWWQYNVLELALPLSDPDRALDAIEARVADGLAPYAPVPVSLVEEHDRFVLVQEYMARQRLT